MVSSRKRIASNKLNYEMIMMDVKILSVRDVNIRKWGKVKQEAIERGVPQSKILHEMIDKRYPLPTVTGKRPISNTMKNITTD